MNNLEKLFEKLTIELLSAKYAYYVKSRSYFSDYNYDMLEKSWEFLGKALNREETSPCIDFDKNHPLASKAIEVYKKYYGK